MFNGQGFDVDCLHRHVRIVKFQNFTHELFSGRHSQRTTQPQENLGNQWHFVTPSGKTMLKPPGNLPVARVTQLCHRPDFGKIKTPELRCLFRIRRCHDFPDLFE